MTYYYAPSVSQPDEHTFLCGYNKVRKYGTTSNLSDSRSKAYVNYSVQPTDTLQGVALRHNCSVSEIVRLNKLWSADALHFKEYIRIPIHCENQSTENVSPSTSEKCVDDHQQTKAVRGIQATNGAGTPETMKDILTRIDAVIKVTSTTVKKLEKQSTIESLPEQQTKHKSLCGYNESYQMM